MTKVTADKGHTKAASQLVTRSTRHPVNSSHSQLVTGQLVTRSTRQAVDSSRRGGQLVTSKHQNRTANNVLVPQLLGRGFQKARLAGGTAGGSVELSVIPLQIGLPSPEKFRITSSHTLRRALRSSCKNIPFQ